MELDIHNSLSLGGDRIRTSLALRQSARPQIRYQLMAGAIDCDLDALPSPFTAPLTTCLAV